MSYESITTVEQFRALDPDQQTDCIEWKRQAARQHVNNAYDQAEANRQLESALVPTIPVRSTPPKPPEPLEPLGVKLDQPAPSEVEESRARRIFEANPGISEVQIGNTVYFKRK